MAQSVFLLHELHGGASRMRRANEGDVARRACSCRHPASPHLIPSRRARAALCQSARRRAPNPARFVVATLGLLRNRRQSPFQSVSRPIAVRPDKQATRTSQMRAQSLAGLIRKGAAIR